MVEKMEAQSSIEKVGGVTGSEEYGGEDEEFYEEIEAPKFVDFTLPHHYCPDDRYWFCSRVGCDQRHEQEMDSEEIYKNFVLRVMAARSPNVRFRKALIREGSSSMDKKCPLSAPPKSSRPRISRLALISSIPQKMVNEKGKNNSSQKLTSTPKAKGRQVAAKYMTTPRNKKCQTNPHPPRSVQNPKPSTLVVPKNRDVAKALVFHSPRKAICVKSSVHLSTSITKVSAGMKRLEINSQGKHVLGNSSKSTAKTKCNPKNSVPKKSSEKQLGSCKDKRKIQVSSIPEHYTDKEASLSRSAKGSKSRMLLSKQRTPMPKNKLKNESTNLKSEGKLKCQASDILKTIEENGKEKHLPTVKVNKEAEASDVSPSRGNSSQLLSDVSLSEEKDVAGNDPTASQAQNGERYDKIEVTESKGNTKFGTEQGRKHIREGIDYQTSEVAGHENKENVAYEENRDYMKTNKKTGRKILQETHENIKKVSQLLDKNPKDGVTAANISTPGVKYKKPKPTTPKPFRLRTDERRILKEANMERKSHFLDSTKELNCAGPRGRLVNDVQRTENCNEDSFEDGERETDNNFQIDELKQNNVDATKAHPKSENKEPKSTNHKSICRKKHAIATPKTENNPSARKLSKSHRAASLASKLAFQRKPVSVESTFPKGKGVRHKNHKSCYDTMNTKGKAPSRISSKVKRQANFLEKPELLITNVA